VLLVTTRTQALIILGGLATSIAASALYGVTLAGMVALATLWFASSRPSMVGTLPEAASLDGVDPRAVRRYRKEHPSATIGEAAVAVARS
jgi:hypothetical protein